MGYKSTTVIKWQTFKSCKTPKQPQETSQEEVTKSLDNLLNEGEKMVHHTK